MIFWVKRFSQVCSKEKQTLVVRTVDWTARRGATDLSSQPEDIFIFVMDRREGGKNYKKSKHSL